MMEKLVDEQCAAMPGRIVGIDASRNRSGGARAHIIGILSAAAPADFGIAEIHVWSYSALLVQLPDVPWLIKHCPPQLAGSIFQQLWWQGTKFKSELRESGCGVLLSTDAGSVCRFTPSVVMSRDMLSFEAGEIERYGFSLARLRLLLLRWMQVASLRRASASLFLTQYASNVIQQFSGPLHHVRIIPHGIGDNFRAARSISRTHVQTLKCVYVSNADEYKHQWHVIEAVHKLRSRGHSLTLELVGAGDGRARDRVSQAVQKFDPEGAFVKITPAVSHDAIPGYLAAADIFIFASSCENMPNTLVEAMASHIAIACSERGPMPEILQDGGEYFDPESPVSIEAALLKLAESSKLRELRADRAKSLSDHFSWRRCAAETWKFLVDVANQQPMTKNLLKTTNQKTRNVKQN